MLGALYSFPNTLWTPVLTALLFNSNLGIVAFNYALLALSVWLFTQAVELDVGLFLGLILLNLTSTITLLSVNKEIFDLLVTALFVYYLAKGRRAVLAAALLLALLNRYEVCLAMILFLGMRSRFNPFRRSRWKSLVAVTLTLSVLIALLLSSPALDYRFEEAVNSSSGSSGLIVLLDQLQMHYLFFVAVIPKIMGNLFAELLNASHWAGFSMEDPANTFVLFFNNLASLCVVLLLIVRRRFSLRSEWLYYAAVNAIMMSNALVIQPRYFYGCYLLLCLEGARKRPRAAAAPLAVRARVVPAAAKGGSATAAAGQLSS